MMVRYRLEIAVALPVRETFSYDVPEHLAQKAEVGCRVLIPFRNRKVTGYILEKTSGSSGEGLKKILDILDPVPLFHSGLIPFFQWMADYYLYPIGRLIQAALPAGLNVSRYKAGRLTEKGIKALKILPSDSDDKKLLEWIGSNPDKKLPSPLHRAYDFQKRGFLIIEERKSKRRAGPLLRKFIRFKEGVDFETVVQGSGGSLRAQNEYEFLRKLFRSSGILAKDLSSEFKNGAYLINKWVRKGVLESYRAPVFRNGAGEIMFLSPVPEELYEQQKEALKLIETLIHKKGFSTSLLYGVTGSGKTEVYYRAVEHVIGLGRKAILMVPEIALAVYMEGMFRSRLGDRVAMFHSGLSDGERYDQWIRIAKGEVDLVIGARSALFVPIPDLGLIIVDEEHDSSYKQEEAPRYQARDAAVVRGKIEKVPVILGSGTPSIQSFHNALTERYHLLTMPERVERRPLPDVQVVDMKELTDGEKKDGLISSRLMEALGQSLSEGKQAILFLNRRGFHRLFICRICGKSIKCLNCDVSLTYHLKGNLLVCHHCGFQRELQNKCPSCGHIGIKAYGFGTERLENELTEIFPGARIARMDRDSTRPRGRTLQILKKFSEHEIDLLIGTQMITKGYDFPNVTLVGVIAADLSLGFPDFRAGERTFQILSQVVGRAGRGDWKGEVIIQTFNPEHYAIAAAREHDYESFFKNEMDLRKQLGYPPFSYLAALRFQGNSQERTSAMARRLGDEMKRILKRWPKRGREIQILGPVEAPLSKLKGKYRWHLLLKSQGAQLLHYFLEKVEELSTRTLRGSDVRLIIDVDPYQML